MITVKIARLPGTINEFALNDNSTVGTALGVAKLSADGYETRVNGAVVSNDHVLRNNDSLMLVRRIKGNNHIEVRVGRLPGTIQTIALNGDRSVKTALTAAGLSSDGYDIRVNGQTAHADSTLRQGDTLLLVRRIKGNA